MNRKADRRGDKQGLPVRSGLPPMPALRAFDAVARLGGIRRAADALAIDHSAISRHLRALETWIGAPLVVRGTRPLELTDTGRNLHGAVGPALDAICAATLGASAARRRNRLAIWCAPDFAALWLAPRFPAFRALYPDLDIELRPSSRAADLLFDAVDVEIAYFPNGGFVKPDRVEAAELCNPPLFPVASPAYLAQHPPVECPSDLLSHRLIHEAQESEWRDWFAANGIPDPGSLTGPKLWQGNLTLQAVRQHQGIALATPITAGDDLNAGRVVEIKGGRQPFIRPPQGPYYLLAGETNWNRSPVARFRDWLTAQLHA